MYQIHVNHIPVEGSMESLREAWKIMRSEADAVMTTPGAFLVEVLKVDAQGMCEVVGQVERVVKPVRQTAEEGVMPIVLVPKTITQA